MATVRCNQCGYAGMPETFSPVMTHYPGFVCPKCNTTDIDASELAGPEYGYGDRNTLNMSKLVEKLEVERLEKAVEYVDMKFREQEASKPIDKLPFPLAKLGVGKFYVSVEVLESEPNKVMDLLARCVVTHCEFQFHRGEFEYIAFSPDFEKPSEPYVAPTEIHEYLWIFTYDDVTKKTSITAKRVDKL